VVALKLALAIRRGGGVTQRWSPLLAYVVSAFYIWTLLWLALWVAVPALILRWEPVLITSDSMAPKVRSGDFVLMSGTRQHLAEGTVVTFRMDDRLVTHRIVAVNPDGSYLTQGDANQVPDSTPLDHGNIEGTPRLLVSTVGIPLQWLRQGKWTYLAVWLAVTVLAVVYLLRAGLHRPSPGPPDAGAAARGKKPEEEVEGGRPSLVGAGRATAVALAASLVVASAMPAAAAFFSTTSNQADSLTASEWELIVSLAGGTGHTCGVNDEGVVWCWGLNDKGQLGDATTADHNVPVRVGGLTGVASLGAGSKHSCGAKGDGTLWCWGLNNQGQLGDGTQTDRSVPVQVGGLSGVIAVGGGLEHSCGLKSDGTVRCWGLNDKGQLGNGTTTRSSVPVQVSGLSGVVALGIGSKHSCGVKSDGSVWCWGHNNEGQLGNGTTTDSSVPVQVAGLSSAVAVSGGVEHGCSVKGDETVWCWGRNDKGQLGDGTTTGSLAVVQVKGVGGVGVLGSAVDIASGLSHNCARLSDATVRCWGLNNKGQLGNGTTTDSATPVQVKGVAGVGNLTGIVTIGSGDSHGCGAHQLHTVYCWGLNNKGQLGNDTTDDSSTPVGVVSLGRADAGFVSLAGGTGHTCGVNDEGVVWCWGLNDKGQLGDATTADHNVPVRVGGLTGVASLGAGSKHSCGAKGDGTLWCWGLNNQGQLGDGTQTDRSVPVQVGGLSGVIAVGGGLEHSCGLKSDGTVRCWGLNDKGQLGNGTTTRSSVPVQVSGLSGVVALGIGSKHSCGVKSDGSVWCWGHNNEGQLGNGTTTDSSVPVQVAGLSSAVAVSGGVEHGCSVKGDETVWCWGRNDKGQLGDGTTTGSLAVVQVKGVGGVGVLGSAVDIASGLSHNCARLSDATVRCWGLNNKGQLGNGTTTDSATPVQVKGVAGVGNLTGIVTIGSGDSHGCGAHQLHTVYCWGLNNKGQLGNDTTDDSSTPVAAIGT
jgi:signal peptidase I